MMSVFPRLVLLAAIVIVEFFWAQRLVQGDDPLTGHLEIDFITIFVLAVGGILLTFTLFKQKSGGSTDDDSPDPDDDYFSAA